MANFIKINFYGADTGSIPVFENNYDKPMSRYINLDLVEHVSELYKNEKLIITKSNGTESYMVKTNWFSIKMTSGLKYILPENEYSKFIKEESCL